MCVDVWVCVVFVVVFVAAAAAAAVVEGKHDMNTGREIEHGS